jgi:PilZ domain
MDDALQPYSEVGSRMDQSEEVPSTGMNRRQHPRRACHYQALCRSGGRAWWPVRFIDLSVGGAGVLLSSPIETGAEVVFTVHTPSGEGLSIGATVRRVQTCDGEWLAGCEFKRLLTESEFLKLA